MPNFVSGRLCKQSTRLLLAGFFLSLAGDGVVKKGTPFYGDFQECRGIRDACDANAVFVSRYTKV